MYITRRETASKLRKLQYPGSMYSTAQPDSFTTRSSEDGFVPRAIQSDPFICQDAKLSLFCFSAKDVEIVLVTMQKTTDVFNPGAQSCLLWKADDHHVEGFYSTSKKLEIRLS